MNLTTFDRAFVALYACIVGGLAFIALFLGAIVSLNA